MKRIATVLGSQPLISVALADADTQTALNMVTSKLARHDDGHAFSESDIAHIEILGGRSSDLQNVSSGCICVRAD